MHQQSLSRIVRTFIVAAAVSATMSLSAQMVNQVRPYNGWTVNPCNGETVNYTGSVHFHEKTQVSTDGRIHFVASENFHATGTGASTGATYNLSGNMHANSKFPSFPITFRQRNRFIASTTAVPSFVATFAFHVNGAGVQTQVTMETSCN